MLPALLFVSIAWMPLRTGPALAGGPPAPSPSLLCDRAIAATEQETGLPPRLLDAIADVESGRLDPATGTVHPWPWTINAEGEGRFFASKAEAVAAVQTLQELGVRSIDVGCMQVNLMHHPTAFASLDEAFDPWHNTRYASRFLLALHGADSTWLPAIAAYHSMTPALGSEYSNRVMAVWERPDLVTTAALVLHTPYRDFVAKSQVYADFKPSTNVYGAFAPAPAPRPAKPTPGTKLARR
jgi:hypothetical protein